ncbi:hypothetical protein VP01_619g5 [Puccinia sorghi]|uniref:Reverse transcriptase domain-containing protein n=1 Tax=Puccinia sorghi TaxID=27349 RepID=A0A0L6UGS8_9BASI|nr:hypothetical protein VP01_619g5 [Puccinia sorghi]
MAQRKKELTVPTVLPENVGEGSAQWGERLDLTWRSDPREKTKGLDIIGDLVIPETVNKAQTRPSVISGTKLYDRDLLQGCTRYILTNVGSISTVQMHSALENSLRHHKNLYKGIVKIKPILQPNRRRRFDLWVKHESSAGLQKALNKSMLPRYRLYLWKAYRDRPLKPNNNVEVREDQKLNLLTWNINGIKSKLPALKHLLQEKQIAIVSIQEHLRTIKNYVPGFRGQCLYVHQSLNAHEIDTQTKHIIYVKVYEQTGAHPWHIRSIYMPSGSSRGKDRGVIWGYLYTLLKNLFTESDASPPYVTVLGDLDDEEKQILNHVRKSNLRNLHLEIIKDPNTSTRSTNKTEGRYIDHFLNTPEVVSMVQKVTVEKSLFNISDHWPVIQSMKKLEKPIAEYIKPKKAKTWNRKGIDGHGWELALSKRWDALTVDEIQDETQLNETATWWILNLTKKHYNLLRNLDVHAESLKKHIRDQNRAKLAIKKFAKLECSRKSQKINQLLLQNKGQSFHHLLQQGQGKQHGNMDNTPCFNEKGELVTSTEEILQARAEYSAKLASDPTGISTNPARWTHVRPKSVKRKEPSDSDFFNSNDEDSDTSINEEVTLTAPDFLLAIRQIQRNAAPGKNGVLAMHLKKFLEIECQVQISQDWKGAQKYGETYFPMPLDYSTVALDCWSLPQKLMVPPLKHLLNIMRGRLRLKTQPKIWNEEVLINLPKPGQDQRWLKNTRGITLSCTEGKLLLTIIATKISKKLEKEKFFSKTQAGFRQGQEAVVHVVSLSEILKRRSNNKQNTFAIYVDFKKAFDRVPHEGLWAKLRQIGIHNDLIEIIKKGYDSSKIQCRLGDQLSKSFTREIGTQQGCPFTPPVYHFRK